MTESSSESAPRPAPRIRFGKAPHQLLDAEVAEAILCELSELEPVLFGRLLAEALIGAEAVPPKRTRAPR